MNVRPLRHFGKRRNCSADSFSFSSFFFSAQRRLDFFKVELEKEYDDFRAG